MQRAAARSSAWLVGALLLAPVWIGGAHAFPFLDPTNEDSTPGAAPLGTELPASDVSGLRNQLRLVAPGALGNASAWTVTPRLSLQEVLTDNAYEVRSPRVFDATTVIAPGVSVLADTARLRLNLDYQPTLAIHAVNGNLNALTQQLSATGIVTVVPDWAYIDLQALSGVQSRYAAYANGGTLGQGASNNGPSAGFNGQGLNRNNEVQTSTFGISPYILHDLGDYGSFKLGASANYSRSTDIKGFASSPLPSGSANGTQLYTTEEIAHYTSGEFLSKFQYTFDVDVLQSRSTQYAQTVISSGSRTTIAAQSYSSNRETLNNQISYAVTRELTLLAAGGYQRVEYSNGLTQDLNGFTWNVGFTYAPGPDTTLTMTYGHINGANTVQAAGYFAVGGRSQFSISYANTVGTQLENLQNQLNNSAIGPGGIIVDVHTATPTIIASNQFGVSNGVFRYKTFNATWTTVGMRDTWQVSVGWSEQSSLTPGPAFIVVAVDPQSQIEFVVPGPPSGNQTVDVTTASMFWSHDLSPDLTMSTSGSFTYIHRPLGLNDTAFSAAIGLQYLLSPSTTLSARYSFFDRVSGISGNTLYENLLFLGVTRQF